LNAISKSAAGTSASNNGGAYGIFPKNLKLMIKAVFRLRSASIGIPRKLDHPVIGFEPVLGSFASLENCRR
jgi:hypothetical protein